LTGDVGGSLANGFSIVLCFSGICIKLFFGSDENGVVGYYLFLNILNFLLILQGHLILAINLFILDEQLHNSQRFFIFKLNQIELLRNQSLCLIAPNQLPQLHINLPNI